MNILGLMSGSSLDGLDMALCRFKLYENGAIDHQLLEFKKVDFSDFFVEKLATATEMTSQNLFLLEAELSSFIGVECEKMIESSQHEVDLIASHGHTIFHFPEYKFTTQLGNGGLISQIAKRDVVSDFRSSDIGAGGLGAPCAPIADRYLFPDANLFLNIGGISNLSYKNGNKIIAFDISPANQLLNHLAARAGQLFDRDGEMAARGQVNKVLLGKLSAINNLQGAEPRALDNSWVRMNFIPELKEGEIPDLLRTSVEFIVIEIIKAIELLGLPNRELGITITGGGALNKFLVSLLEKRLAEINVEIIVIPDEIINFKEAMLIALMGFLRYKRIPNVLKTVTGASKDTVGGCVYVY